MALLFTPNRGGGGMLSVVQGPQGDQGIQGIQGIQGVTGNTGATGTAATITAGTTTTLAEGNSATASNSGTSAAAIWDFGIPRGATPAIGFTFSTTTTDADPGNGIVRFNNATTASVTSIYFDNLDRDGNTVSAWLDTFDDSTNTAKGTLTFTAAATPSTKLIYAVSSSVVDGTGYRKVTVTHVSGTTLPSNAAHLGVTFSPAGNKGTDGVGTGDVVGPSSATDNAIARFDSTTGKLIQNSGVIIDDSNNFSTTGNVTGGLVITSTTGYFGYTGRSLIYSPSDGVLELVDSTASTFSRLQLGGTTASFPSIKRNSAALDLRLADDSAYANLNAANLFAAGTIVGQNIVTAFSTTAIPAGGSAGTGVLFSSTANFGTFFGSGAPTLSAAQGSIYLRSNGFPQVNTNGTTGWAELYGVGGTDVAVADGGTGSSTAGGARTNLGLVPDTDIPSQTSFNALASRHNYIASMFLS